MAYDEAIALNPNDMTYYNNKAAVLIEQGKFEDGETILRKTLENRYDMNSAFSGGASYEKCAKLLNRLASVYLKQGKYAEAIAAYNKSLTEDNNKNTRNLLRDAQAAAEKFEKESYIDPVKAEAHREKGNQFFKEGKFADAKGEYDEAIRRNPSDAKLYSNRAAALTKLIAYPDALRDLDECLRLDPNFVKAYSRKGTVHFSMKDYNKAIEAYDAGLAIDPSSTECRNGKAQVIGKINETQSGEEDEERVKRSMANPEIQQILSDPQMRLILGQLQENPARAGELMADPKIAAAIQKLVAAGILRTR